jgi:putative hydrolase of the HAD superfamily
MNFSTIDIKNKKGVLIDLDNTLYEYDPCHNAALSSCRVNAFENYQIDSALFDESFAQARKFTHNQLNGQAASHSRLLYFHKQFEILFNKSNPDYALKMEDNYWKVFFSKMKLKVGVMDFLSLVKRNGLKTCIITDLTTQIQMLKWQHLGLGDFLDFIVTSEEAGVEKPSEVIFNIALSKLNLQSSEVIMIGDHPEKDIAAAQKLGIKSYLII